MFPNYGFKSGNGMFRRGTPEGFPQGLRWDVQRDGNTIMALRCCGFDPDFEAPITNEIRGDIRRMFRDAPCVFTGTLTAVELDHRAGDKQNPLHASALVPATQVAADFMPLCRSINQIKREACKSCCATGCRPPLPPLFAHLEMIDGEGCHGCFWFEPESYVPSTVSCSVNGRD